MVKKLINKQSNIHNIEYYYKSIMDILPSNEKRFKLFHTLMSNEDKFGIEKWLDCVFPDYKNNWFRVLPKDIVYMILDNLLCQDKESAISFARTCSLICGFVEFRRFKSMHDYKRVERLILKGGSRRIAEYIISNIMTSEFLDLQMIFNIFNSAIEYGYTEIIQIILDSKKYRTESVYIMEYETNPEVNYLNLSSDSEYKEIIVESKKFVPSKNYVLECINRAIRFKKYDIILLLLDYPSFDPSVNDSFWENFTEKKEKYYNYLEDFKDSLKGNNMMNCNINELFGKWKKSFSLL